MVKGIQPWSQRRITSFTLHLVGMPWLQKNLVTPPTSPEVKEDNDRHCITFGASVSTLRGESRLDLLQVGELFDVRRPLPAEEVHLDDLLPIGALSGADHLPFPILVVIDPLADGKERRA